MSEEKRIDVLYLLPEMTILETDDASLFRSVNLINTRNWLKNDDIEVDPSLG